MKKSRLKGAQIRDTTGFERLFSAYTSQKPPRIRQVFPTVFVLPKQKIARSKLLSTSKRKIFVSDKAKSAGILIRIPSIFNAEWRKKILFEAIGSLTCTP